MLHSTIIGQKLYRVDIDLKQSQFVYDYDSSLLMETLFTPSRLNEIVDRGVKYHWPKSPHSFEFFSYFWFVVNDAVLFEEQMCPLRALCLPEGKS